MCPGVYRSVNYNYQDVEATRAHQYRTGYRRCAYIDIGILSYKKKEILLFAATRVDLVGILQVK